MHDFDRIELITRRLGRAALVGIPCWIVLLWVLPLSGLGVMPCLLLATLLAGAVVVVDGRRRRARAQGAARGATARAGGPRSSMSPLAAVGLTLLVVAVLGYVLLVVAQT